MNSLAPYFVLVPLLLYLPMLIYESWIALRRIGKPKESGGQYLHATWESTHTFLILAINNFLILYPQSLKEIASRVFVPLLVFGGAFILRAITYVWLFYIKSHHPPHLVLDWLFALAHLAMIISLGISMISVSAVLTSHTYQASTTVLALMIPGAILVIPLLIFPLFFLYYGRNN